jgi:hypothetical protein
MVTALRPKTRLISAITKIYKASVVELRCTELVACPQGREVSKRANGMAKL